MFSTFKFYWDNLKRFERKQILYLIIHRIKNRVSRITNLNNPRPISRDHFISRTLFEMRLYELIFIDNGIPIWDFWDTEEIKDIPYFEDLRINLNQFIAFPQKIWSNEHLEMEVSNNYERFYLFLEAFIDLKTQPKHVINVMTKFISLNEFKITRCWSGFNIALRIINWLKILTHFCQYMDEREWMLVQQSLYEHYFLLKNKIEYHIPGNHILYQLFSLWIISILFPGWEKSDNWDDLIIKEINKQFLKGGLHFELGFHYHVQATIVCLYWLMIRRRFEKEKPTDVFITIQQAVKIIDKFVLADGTVPMIGDNCFCFFHQNLSEDILNIRKLSTRLLGFPNEIEKSLSNISNNYLISEFSDSKLIMDIGQLGYKSNPGHGHSDILSIIYFQKVPIFIDPGTRRYFNSDEDKLLKESVSHNTLTINGAGQAQLGSYFRWAFLPQNINFSYRDLKNEHELIGSYCGFRQIGAFIHSRKVLHRNDNLEIDDEIRGMKNVDIQLNFVLHPNLNVDQEGKLVLLKDILHSWTIRFLSEEKFLIKIVPIHIYIGYSQGIPSYRINVLFKSVNLPFKCKTIIHSN